MTGRYIVQVAFQGPSGIPKDQFENVWHFTGTGASKIADAHAAASRAAAFYMLGTGDAMVANYLSFWENFRVGIKVYDEDEVLRPRTILYSDFMTLPERSGAQASLPEEVALCLSYYSTQNAPRHRGRLYVGPLDIKALGTTDEQDAGPSSTPGAALIVAMVGAATAIKGDRVPTAEEIRFLGGTVDNSASVEWCLRSGGGTKAATKTGIIVYEPVTHGWVDNEWDAQRRRRIQATARSVF